MAELRTIDELISIHELEPEIKSIFVEGDSDQGFLTWFIHDSGIPNVSVYEIATINFSNDEVQVNSNKNNKQKLFDLCNTISQKNKDLVDQIICVVDKDLDDYFNKGQNPLGIVTTDYSCMEMYGFTKKVLQKLFLVYARRETTSIDDLFSNISSILCTLAQIHIVNENMKLGCSRIDIDRCLSISENKLIKFKDSDYICRYLNTHGKLSQKDLFIKEINLIAPKLTLDIRNYSNGHDLINLLSFYIRRVCKPSVNCEESILARTFFLSIENNDIKDQNLFIFIGKWGNQQINLLSDN